jgi:hypothetical protein
VASADPAIGNVSKRLIGTHHSVSRERLQVCLDEFVLRPTDAVADGSFPDVTRLGPTRKAPHHSLILAVADPLALTPGGLGAC